MEQQEQMVSDLQRLIAYDIRHLINKPGLRRVKMPITDGQRKLELTITFMDEGLKNLKFKLLKSSKFFIESVVQEVNEKQEVICE